MLTTPTQVQQVTPAMQHPAPPFLHQQMISRSGAQDPDRVIFHNGITYYKMSEHKTHYKCSQQKTKGKSSGALVDGGTNGGFGGDGVLVIEYTYRKADVTGIDEHKLGDLPIDTCHGRIMTTRGPAIAVMHQYTYHGKVKLSMPQNNWGILALTLMINLSLLEESIELSHQKDMLFHWWM
jgi:hypothetical protein